MNARVSAGGSGRLLATVSALRRIGERAALALLLVASCDAVGQQAQKKVPRPVAFVTSGHLACPDAGLWQEQQRYRDEKSPQHARIARKLLLSGRCEMTRDTQRVVLYPAEIRGAVRVRFVASQDTALHYLSIEAVRHEQR